MRSTQGTSRALCRVGAGLHSKAAADGAAVASHEVTAVYTHSLAAAKNMIDHRSRQLRLRRVLRRSDSSARSWLPYPAIGFLDSGIDDRVIRNRDEALEVNR